MAFENNSPMKKLAVQRYGNDFELPKVFEKKIEVIREYDTLRMSIADFNALCVAKISEIPAEHRASAEVIFEGSDCSQVSMEIAYSYRESQDECARRVSGIEATILADAQRAEVRERYQYNLLKAKFDPE